MLASLTLSNLSYRFGDQILFENVSFTINSGDRMGLVGANGVGKTTLLRILMGELASPTGSIMPSPANLRVGYLPQGFAADDATPIKDMLSQQAAAEAEVERLAAQLTTATDDEMDAVLMAYGNALENLEQITAQEPDIGTMERILAGLALDHIPQDTPISALSGGQKTRLGLAALLLQQPHILILDEPTNHLDVTALEWLADWLVEFEGGVLVVSHDRTFLDDVTTHIVALDHQQTRIFDGDYSDYVASVRSERDKQWAKWRDQQIEIARMQLDIQRTMAKAVRRENATVNDHQRRLAKKVAKRAKSKETRLQRYLDSDERVDKPEQAPWTMRLDFDELPTSGQDVIDLEDLSVGYDTVLLSSLNLSVRSGERIAILGPNGHGKSTLLKTIMGEVAPLAGRVRIGASVKIGYLAQEQEILNPSSLPVDLVQGATGFGYGDTRSFLHYFLFTGDDALRPVGQLSYGERARLMLALLVGRGSNVMILDEPINHLDVPSREQFEAALKQFKGTVLAVVHDRYFVQQFATTIWHIADGNLTPEVRVTTIS